MEYIILNFLYFLLIPPFLLFCCWLHSSTQRIEWFPLPLGEFRSVSTADLEDPSRGSRNNAGNGDVSELQIDRKKSVPYDTVIRSTTWHATSYVKKIMQSSGANLMKCFTTNLPFCWGAKGGFPFLLRKSYR